MRRDLDLIRGLLMAIEAESENFKQFLGGRYEQRDIDYHLWLLLEAGLVTGSDATHLGSPHRVAVVTGLTWDGHEFLDAAKSDTLWNRATSAVGIATGGLASGVLQSVLTQLGTNAAMQAIS